MEEALLLLLALVLLARQRCCCAASEGGFSVEFIHRDSARSPFHDPALSPSDRMLAAARRSFAYNRGAAKAVAADNGVVVSQIFTRSFEYLMSVNVGTPPRQSLAIADTGSDLVWIKCSNGGGDPSTAETSPADDDDGPSPSGSAFDPSESTTYGVVSCQSAACRPLNRASCDANSHCQYQYGYGDGSRTTGVLSTETFTFGNGSVRVPRVRFGCSTYSAGTFKADGIVGLGDGPLSLVSQLGAALSTGRSFSYCLVPYDDASNASSALNFGAKAVVSGPGAATTPMVASDVPAYYTVGLEAVAVGGKTVASKSSHIIVDSGTTLTFLEPELLQPLATELEQRISLPRTQSPEQLLNLCYDVTGQSDPKSWGIPDVTLRFGGGAAVTLRPVNTFVMVQTGTLCLALVPVSESFPVSILGNVAQQNLHVGYNLDARSITFATADCANLAS